MPAPAKPVPASSRLLTPPPGTLPPRAGVITAPCDNDINNLCLDKGKSIALAKQPGGVGTCLATILEEQAAAESPAAAPARRLLDDDKAKKKVRTGSGSGSGSGWLGGPACRPGPGARC